MANATRPRERAGARVRLFDADRTDRMLELDEALEERVSGRQLLWIDLEGEADPNALQALVERFELDDETTRALKEPGDGPHLQLHGRHFHVRVAAEPDADRPDEVHWLDAVAGPNVVVTRHAEHLELLDVINEQITADASIGELDSAEFVAALLEAVVTSYHAAVDRIEDEIDRHETRALAQESPDAGVERLVTLRRRVGRLRRLLASHRQVFATIGRPDFARGVESSDPEVFVPVSHRYDAAIASVEATRQLVMSSFDVLMTRTAQRTNDVMRVLTLVTVLALPATVTAGLLGMNLVIPLPNDQPGAFWQVLLLLVVIEVAIVVLARWRGWI